jgi:hypothetical protein
MFNSIINTVINKFARHGLQLLAALLVANGVFTSAQSASFVDLSLLIIAWGVSQAWSLIDAGRTSNTITNLKQEISGEYPDSQGV